MGWVGLGWVGLGWVGWLVGRLPSLGARDLLPLPLRAARLIRAQALPNRPPSYLAIWLCEPRLPIPCVCAEERRRWRTRACDCLSTAGASSRETRQCRAPQVAPRTARGHRQWGRPFLVTFFSAKRKKVTALLGAHPGTRPVKRARTDRCPCPHPLPAGDGVSCGGLI